MKNIHKAVYLIFLNSSNFLVTTIFILFLSVGCKKETAPVQQQPLNEEGRIQSQDDITQRWGLPDIVVHQGESIQAAVNKAKKNSTILIEPGVYKEDVYVSKAGIKLIGKFSFKGEEVIIKNPGDRENGITVTGDGDGFVLVNVTVKGFEENGVFLSDVENFTISHVKAVDNGEYGIFPVFCTNGVVEFCTATGHSDTGIYIGQSSDVKMQFNTAYANVNGLEVENSSDVDVVLNHSYNNVCGMLIDLLPGKDVKTSSNVHVRWNRLNDNNHKNFGEPGSLEANIPTGIGVLVLGTDQTVVENNIITNNDFTGVVVFSSLVLVVLAGVPPEDFDIEPNPDGGRITKNFLQNNGSNPPSIPDLPLPGVDLLWDGSGINNCWSQNIFATSCNLATGCSTPLPACN